MRLYELAIRSARDNGFVHNEAIAYERASAFYRARGFDEFADFYLRNARYLIDTLMRTAIEQAGAERGLLILPRGAEQRKPRQAAIQWSCICATRP